MTCWHHEWAVHETEKSAFEHFIDKLFQSDDICGPIAIVLYLGLAATTGYLSHGYIAERWTVPMDSFILSIGAGLFLGIIAVFLVFLASMAVLYGICWKLELQDRICIKCQTVDLALTEVKFKRKKKRQLQESLEKEWQNQKDTALATLESLKKTVRDFELDPSDWSKKQLSDRKE